MASSSDTYHEPLATLSVETMDMHRALVSVQEELEAVDWYRQRADATHDPALRAILLHNMREEVEHACMILEWLRRNSADFDEHMAEYLYVKGPIKTSDEDQRAPAREGGAGGEAEPPAGAPPLRLTLGSLKQR